MDDDKRVELELSYAWGWFQYHAAQRLQAFHFFLIIVGVAAVAYAQAIEHEWEPLGVAIGLLGAVVSFGFLALDVRNADLVECGRAALSHVESSLTLKIMQEDRKTRRSWTRHNRWLRGIEGGVAVLFLAGVAWAASGFCGA